MEAPIKLKDTEFCTSDLSLATYFCFRAQVEPKVEAKYIRKVGCPEQFGRRRRVKYYFVFEMDRNLADDLTAEYANSAFPAFEGIRRGLSKDAQVSKKD